VTLLRLVAVLAAGVAVFVVVAALDLTRAPDQRSHIGRFAAQVLDGQAATVLGRKLEDNLTAAGPVWLTIVLSVLMLAVGALLAAPGPIGVRVRALRWPAERLTAIGARWPELRSGVLALLLTAVVAVLANDSGIVLAPAFVATLAPLLVMAGALTPRRPPARTNRATS